MHRLAVLVRGLALAMAALILMGPAAFADDAGAAADTSRGWYVGGSAGIVLAGGLNNRNISTSTVGGTFSAAQGFNLTDGPSLAAQVGYQRDSYRVEGEFLYQSFGRNGTTATFVPLAGTTTTTTVSGSDLSTYSGFINGYYDFKTSGRFSPYLGAGVGVTKIDSSASTSAGTLIVQAPGIDQTAFAYQAKVGVSYAASPQTSLFLQYRYMGTSGFRYGQATVISGTTTVSFPGSTGSLSNHAFELGARFRF